MEKKNRQVVFTSAMGQDIYTYTEGKTYVTSPGDAPKGTALKRGPRGGYYYEEPAGKGDTTKQVPSEMKYNPHEKGEGELMKDYGLSKGQKIKTPSGEMGKVIGMTHDGLIASVDSEGNRHSDFTPDEVTKDDKEQGTKEPMDISREREMDWIASTLMNDENSSDEEMMKYFMDEGKMSEPEAKHYINQRSDALSNMEYIIEPYESDQDKEQGTKEPDTVEQGTKEEPSEFDNIYDDITTSQDSDELKDLLGTIRTTYHDGDLSTDEYRKLDSKVRFKIAKLTSPIDITHN